jgi:hypothetical protein
MYNGELGKGAVFLFALCVAIVPLSFLVPRSYNSLIAAMMILLALWIAIVVDAGKRARRTSATFVPKAYNKSWAYVIAALFVLAVVQPLMTRVVTSVAFDVSRVSAGEASGALLPGDVVVAGKTSVNGGDRFGRQRYVMFSIDSARHVRFERTGMWLP